jgi:hypothetical protein
MFKTPMRAAVLLDFLPFLYFIGTFHCRAPPANWLSRLRGFGAQNP